MYYNSRNIQGKQFNQQTLQLDLHNVTAGQNLIAWIIIILVSILIFFLPSIIAGFFGTVVSLQIIVDTGYRLNFTLTIFVIIIFLINAIYQKSIHLLLIVIGFIIAAIILPMILANLGIIKLTSNFLPITPYYIIVGLVSCSICFYTIQFSFAVIDALYRFKFLNYIVSVISIISGGVLGSLTEVSLELQYDQFSKYLSLDSFRVSILIAGTVFVCSIAFCAWLANRFRNIPWNHQSLLSSWALAVGSWGGTSFYNLDLSNVNFRNATLPNTDLRAKKLYRTCFQGSKGLERARVNSSYIDLEIPKVQKLLTKKQGYGADKDFSHLNLRGAFLQDMVMRRFNFTDTDLIGADMRGANLCGSIFVRTQVIDVDFTEADLTGICIENWSVNSQTCFTNVTCNYVYRKLDDKGKGTDRFPAHRDFKPREFESLYQEVENVIEIIFQEGENWQAALYSLVKLQMEDEKLELELKGVEKRGDIWVVKVTYNDVYPKQQVEHLLNSTVEEMKLQLAAKEQQIYLLEQEKRDLLGIAKDQAKALEGYSRQRESLSESNNFFISGSTITNLAGSGQIDYGEAATQVRSIVANSNNSGQLTTILQNFLTKVQRQNLASTEEMQADLMQHIILTEAEKDMVLKQFLLQQGEQVVAAFPKGILAIAIRDAIAQLTENS